MKPNHEFLGSECLETSHVVSKELTDKRAVTPGICIRILGRARGQNPKLRALAVPVEVLLVWFPVLPDDSK